MRGLCTPEQMESCPLARHFSDEHHIFYPAYAYQDSLGNAFRELPDNKVQLCRNDHENLHRTQPLPERPSTTEMIDAMVLSGVHLNSKLRRRIRRANAN